LILLLVRVPHNGVPPLSLLHDDADEAELMLELRWPVSSSNFVSAIEDMFPNLPEGSVAGDDR
jgi:hypothetical protein